MPQTRGAYGPHKSTAIRAGIITARHCFGASYPQIAGLFRVHPTTAQGIYDSARQRAGNSEDVTKILEHCEEAPGRGRRPNHPPGSTVSKRLREVSQQDAFHQDLPHSQIAIEVSKELDIYIDRTTADRILKGHHNIFRYRPRLKPPLTRAHRASRYELACWALPHIEAGDIFIFSDEFAVESGNHRRLPNISRPADANPYNYCRTEPPTFQSFMFWGAIAYGYGPGPCHMWEKESEKEAAAIKAELATENEALLAKQEDDRRQARIPGTEQHRVLQEINANLRHQDAVNPLPSGRRRVLRRPEWEFKVELAKRDSDRIGGVDWARYRRTILIPRLYAWAKEIEQETGRRVWIIEDNAGPHKKARRMAKGYRIEHGIRVVNWPPRSPDLNKIEEIWMYIKDIIEAQRLDLYNHDGKLSRKLVQKAVLEEWQNLPQGLINNVCEDFKHKLELCKRQEGRNNFNG